MKKLKIYLVFFISIFVKNTCLANMSSPTTDGTKISTVFTSKNIDILSEGILVKIDKNFQKAHYFIEYTIKTEQEGEQIPLLFTALNYHNDFLVWIDDAIVTLSSIDNNFIEKIIFSKILKPINEKGDTIHNEDLKYFEVFLKKGIHKVRVEYISTPNQDNSDWVRKYNYKYALFPAKNWKSFGKLNINIELEDTTQTILTNLGQSDGKNNWNFNQLPADFFEINYHPKVSDTANFLIYISPFGLSIFTFIIFMALHILLIFKFKKNNIAGIFIVPFIFFYSDIKYYFLIDSFIGEHASQRHGYIFILFIFYPILVAIYWYVMNFIFRKFQNI